MENQELNAIQKDSLNRMLYRAEQELLLDKGLPLRPWYKHVLYAPGYYTGYAAVKNIAWYKGINRTKKFF